MFIKFITLFLVLSISILSFAQDVSERDAFLEAKDIYDEGSYSLSIDMFKRFIERFPNSKAVPEAKLYLAQSFFQENKFMEAHDILTKLEQEYVSYGIEDRLLFWLGQIYLKVKDLDQAAEYFGKLITMHPNSSLLYSAKMQLGWIFLQEGRIEEAKGTFDTLAESEDAVIQEEAQFRRGELQFQTKDYNGALNTFKTFAKLFSDSEYLANAYFYMAEASFYLNDFQNAIDYYIKSLEKSDSELIKAESLQGIGWSHLNEGRLQEAEDAFSQMDNFIKEDFNKESLFLGKATLFSRLGRLEESLNYYNKLIELYPQSEMLIQAQLGYAECLSGLSRFEEAVKLYKEIIARTSGQDSERIKELAFRAHYNLGVAYFETGNFDLAIPELNEAVALSSNNETSLNLLYHIAEAYQNAEEFDKAIEIYHRLLKDYPDNSYNDYVLYQLGICQLKANQIETAVLTFKKFNEDFPQSEFIDDVNYYLCYAYYISDQLEMAAHQLGRFLKAFSDSVYTDKASYLLAVSFYRRGLLNEALYHFERIQIEFKHNKDLLDKAEYEIANILYQLGEEEQAVKRFRQFVNSSSRSEIAPNVIFWLGQYFKEKMEYETSRRNFEMLVRMHPNHKLAEEAKYQIGLTFLAEEKFDNALHMFERLLELSEQEELKAKTMLIIGDLLLQEDRKKEAVVAYNELTQLISSNNIDTKVRQIKKESSFMTNALEHKEDLFKVKEGVSKGGEQRQGDDSVVQFVKLAYTKLGDIYKEDGNFVEAISYYEQALRFPLDESSAQIQFKIAETLEQDDKLDDALGKYANIDYNYEQDKVWIVKGLLRSARIYEDRGEWRAAIKPYERISDYNVPESKYAKEKLIAIKKQLGLN